MLAWLKRKPERLVPCADVTEVLGMDPRFIDETGRNARVCTCPSGAISSACPVHKNFLVAMDDRLAKRSKELPGT